MWVLGVRWRRIVLLFYMATWWTQVVTARLLARCRSDDVALTVRCERANLTVVPHMLNPLVRRLHLSHNRIARLAQAFSMYRELVFLDLSHNLLTELGSSSFTHPTSLKVLRLDRNRISSITPDAFQGLNSLQLLRLDHNLLPSLTAPVFRNLSSLEVLDLSNNLIALVEPSAFEGLGALQRLILRDNLLTQVPSASFQRLSNLQVLDMGNNALRLIPGNAFFPLVRLKIISLDGCSLETIQPGAFKNLDNLKMMHLQNNDLPTIPLEALVDAFRVEELHLGQNRIKQLPTLSFQGLRQVRVIVINGDEALVRVEKGAFADNEVLERLYLTHNRNLNFIHENAFQGLENLRYVSLRGNQLSFVPEELLPWDQLEGYDLRDNPLECNCSLLWLWEAIRDLNRTEEERRDIVCESPAHLRDRPLREASVSDLDCDSASRRRRDQILAATASAAGLALALATIAGFLWYRQHAAHSLEKQWKHEELDFTPPPPPPPIMENNRYSRVLNHKLSTPIADL